MAFNKEDVPPQFADLKGMLSQSKITDNALSQMLQILLDRLDQLEVQKADVIQNINNSVNTITSIVNILSNNTATYLTSADESLALANSRQLLAGTGVAFDDTIPNKRTINALAPTDVYDLDYLGNYTPTTYNNGDIVVGPDNITYVCIKDGTTTPPEPWPGGSPGSGPIHHTTHEPGGGDQIANVAWLNLRNMFLTSQEFSSPTTVQIFLRSLGNSVDARLWDILNEGNNLWFRPINDAATIQQSSPLRLTRSGDVHVGGTNGNVACKNQANTFIEDQHINKNQARLILTDSTQAANLKVFDILNTTQRLHFRVMQDNTTTGIGTPLQLDRFGNVFISSYVFERNRAAAMGDWTDIPFNAGNFYGPGSMSWTVEASDVSTNRYALVGRTLYWAININASTLGGTPGTAVNLRLPAGLVAKVSSTALCHMANSAWKVGQLNWQANSGDIQALQIDFSPYPIVPLTNQFYLFFILTIEVQ